MSPKEQWKLAYCLARMARNDEARQCCAPLKCLRKYMAAAEIVLNALPDPLEYRDFGRIVRMQDAKYWKVGDAPNWAMFRMLGVA
jgi:hypothetical protein